MQFNKSSVFAAVALCATLFASSSAYAADADATGIIPKLAITFNDKTLSSAGSVTMANQSTVSADCFVEATNGYALDMGAVGSAVTLYEGGTGGKLSGTNDTEVAAPFAISIYGTLAQESRKIVVQARYYQDCRGVVIGFSDGSALTYWWVAGSSSWGSNTISVPSGHDWTEPHHYVFSFGKATNGKMRLYIDGELASETAPLNNSTSGEYRDPTQKSYRGLFLGNGLGMNNYDNGTTTSSIIDDVRFYADSSAAQEIDGVNYVLSDSMVKELYRSFVYQTLEVTEGTVVDDDTTNAQTITKTAGATTATTLSEAATWRAISGTGRISSDADQTLETDREYALTGAFAGGMKLTLQGDGVFSVLGESVNAGGFDVQGGTLKFASPTNLSGITYNLDATRSDTIETVTVDEVEYTKWSDALGGNRYAQAASYSGGQSSNYDRTSVNAVLTTDYFGGRPSLHSTNFRMVIDSIENQKSVFAVFRLASTGRIIEDASDAWYGPRWYVTRETSTDGYGNRSYSNDPANYGSYMGVNGTIGGTAAIGTETVVSIPFHWSRKNSSDLWRKIAYGAGNEMAWAEVLSFSRAVTLEEQLAVDAFLAGKWGIRAYKPLGDGAVTVGAGGTLDAAGVAATVASLTLDGGTLENAENLTVSGAATFTAGATIDLGGEAASGTKVLVCSSATGLGNLTVTVNGVKAAGLKPRFKNGAVELYKSGFAIILR